MGAEEVTDSGAPAEKARPPGLTERAAARLLRLLSKRVTERPAGFEEASFRSGAAEAGTFLRRFGAPIDFRNKRVLDYGCGYASLSFQLAGEGAAEVTGVDVDQARVDFARRKLSEAYPSLSGKVEFKSPDELADERFDIIVSKDSFQHYKDPAGVLAEMKARLAPGGRIAIGFGPLWKSPYGGAIDFMTKLPWAHLIFPERVILRERLRYRPDEGASEYSEIRGGFNKMTLQRFRDIIGAIGLEIRSSRTNASSGPVGVVSRLLAALPGCREYFTLNVYSILSAPER